MPHLPPPSSSTYPARPGTIVDFSILRDFGTRVAMDEEFRFARILLGTGREVTASFREREFARVNGHTGPLRAIVGDPIFSRGPTSYFTSDAADAADKAYG